MWRFVATLVTTGLTLPVAAQSPIHIESQVESGWTSNATDSVAGAGDLYVTHSHELTLEAASETLVLRGGIGISRTAFALASFEDDANVSARVEGELAIGPNMVLRLGYGATRGWLGDDLAILGVAVPIRSEKVVQQLHAEIAVAGADQQASLGVSWQGTLPGKTEFPGLGIAPLRLHPDVGLVQARMSWEKALSPTLALLGTMTASLTAVPLADQLLYLRAPSDAGQVSGGLRWHGDTVAVEGLVGWDLVWPKGHPALTEGRASYAFKATVDPLPRLRLSLAATSGLELVDPLDAIAGRTDVLDLEAVLAVTEDVEVFGRLGAWREVGLFDPTLERSRHSAALGVRRALDGQVAASVTATLARHDAPAESYDRAGIAIALSAGF